MKAPDKIYLTTTTENEKHGNYWGCWTTRECPGEPYIRKDALLEWLNNEIKKEMEDHYDDFSFGIAYGNVLEHINEM